MPHEVHEIIDIVSTPGGWGSNPESSSDKSTVQKIKDVFDAIEKRGGKPVAEIVIPATKSAPPASVYDPKIYIVEKLPDPAG